MSTIGMGSADEAMEQPLNDAPKQKYKSWKYARSRRNLLETGD